MSRPEKGTPEYELWLCAIEVAAGAPLKQSTYAATAQVGWPRIHRLRSALEALDIDWREVKKKEEASRG